MRGKAPTGFCGSTGRKDHPRMCGEKPERLFGAGDRSWITPACAGKSWSNALPCSRREDHPRVCGEKFFVTYPATYRYGITPACAGKRSVDGNARLSEQDHPRMCGEKKNSQKKIQKRCRITPACAGKRLKRSRSTVPPVAIVPLFPSVCNKPVVSDGSPAGRDAPLFLPAENAVPASPAYNLRSL